MAVRHQGPSSSGRPLLMPVGVSTEGPLRVRNMHEGARRDGAVPDSMQKEAWDGEGEPEERQRQREEEAARAAQGGGKAVPHMRHAHRLRPAGRRPVVLRGRRACPGEPWGETRWTTPTWTRRIASATRGAATGWTGTRARRGFPSCALGCSRGRIRGVWVGSAVVGRSCGKGP